MDRLTAKEAEFAEMFSALQEPEFTLFYRYLQATAARDQRSMAQQAGNEVPTVLRLVKGRPHHG
jgi:hypothetical protein